MGTFRTREWLLPAVMVAGGVLVACTAGQTTGWTGDARPGQGWSPDNQSAWYSATQGSRLIPRAWLLALEQADSDKPFLAPETIAAYRLLPRKDSRLPVGFVIDDNDDSDLTVSRLRWFAGQSSKEQWVGMNCSACHTAELSYRGTALRVDGGPSLFDFQSFIEALDASLRATHEAPDASPKWQRFAKAVLGTRDTAANRVQLREAVGKLLAWEDRVETMNKTPLRYGYGRVDAFGHIFNKVALFNGAAAPTPNPADAPVSYPHIWDIWRHDKLQWNGIAQNQKLKLPGGELDYGALGRNSGEVLGVFGDVKVTPGAGLGGYRSSVQADNLVRLEVLLSRLRAPRWPALFPAPDAARVAQGKALFDKGCAGCHAPQPATGTVKIQLTPLKDGNPNNTDPWMACNAISYRSATGNLKGTPMGYIGSGAKFGDDAPLAAQLETMVKGTLVGKKGQIIAEGARTFVGWEKAPRVVTEESLDMRGPVLQKCFESGSPNFAYKARPLDGIWATAPYLHNGSVPTLYDLLLPADKRPKSFAMGTREYDPIKVGYRSDIQAPGNSFVYRTQGDDGQLLPANGNQGHDYGAAKLSEADRLALLEYLKTL